MLSLGLGVALVAIGLLGGAAIGAIGPGGVFITIALFLLLPLTPAEVAGTASATFIGTGLAGAAMYRNSGEFSTGVAREMVLLLCLSSIFGALVGARANVVLPPSVFGYVLGALIGALGLVIVYREIAGLKPMAWFEHIGAWKRRVVISGTGLGVSALGATFGVGGPVIAVPILVVLGVPTLMAVGLSQVQSIVISGVATFGYASMGAVLISLVFLIGVPQMIGVWLGWRFAHQVNDRLLRICLGTVLILIAPTLLV